MIYTMDVRDRTLGARDFSCAVSGFGQVSKSDPREKPLDQSAIPLIAPSQLQLRLYQTFRIWMFCWLVPWKYRMFQMLWLDYNHNRYVIGTRVVWRWQGANANNPSTHHVRFHFLEGKRKYQTPVRTEDLDMAIAEVIGTFDGVEEIWEGIVNYYLKERHIGGLSDRLWKITAVPVSTWHMQWVKRGLVGNIKRLPRATMLLQCSNEFFSPAGRLWLTKYALILPFVLYWEVVTRLLIFYGLFLVGMICPLMRVESTFFDLFWNVNFFIAAQ